jgi:flagellar basal-body rod modification protein FlgD
MSVQGISPNVMSSTSGTTSGQPGVNSSQTATGSLNTTFLNLLITELKSQDPTAPMDATQMVGQMVSLNQLDQLIGIHQILQGNSGSTPASAASAVAKGGK